MANLENGARVSGFHSIRTFQAPLFTEKFLAEMEVILHKVYAKPVVERLDNFNNDLPEHLYHSLQAHDLDIYPWSEQLIQQLYLSYRDCGYKGTITDMLESIAKFIDIASSGDVALGVSETKAITPPGWRQIFEPHQARKSAHDPLFQRFTELKVFTKDISFHFDYMFPENYTIFTDGYTPEDWNPFSGTFYCEFVYDYPLSEEVTGDGIPVCKFTGVDTEAVILATKTDIVLNITGKNNHTLMLPFSQTPEGIEKLLLVYDRGRIILRDQMSEISVEVDEHFFNVRPVSFICCAPLRLNGDPISIREVSYYGYPASKIEQVFFLN